MALEFQQTPSSDMSARSSVVAALSVYLEPLVADARVAVLGDGELGLYTTLLELGARTVHLFDPEPERVARIADEVPRGVSARMLRDDFDVRDGAFDLVVIPDVGVLPDPSGTIVRLRRVIDPRGAVVAMGRARTASSDDSLFPELAPAAVEYAELYDLFALQFESVTMTGVLPFRGVVFAELGAGDDLAVSVDTRLVDPEPPGVFVVLASREEAVILDPYAIVQIARGEVDTLPTQLVRTLSSSDDSDRNERNIGAVAVAIHEMRDHEVAAAYAAMHLKAEMLAAQLDEHRARLASADSYRVENASRSDDLALERDLAMTRVAELESILAAAQHGLATLERRLIAAEQGMLERDDQLTALNAELDARSNLGEDALTTEHVDPALVANLLVRAERAEAGLAHHIADLAHVAEAHATETAIIEAQLRERAGVIAAMEKELARREQLVRELVSSLEEARDNTGTPMTFEAAPALSAIAPEEVGRLRRKLDDLALEVARRDGELVAKAWQITELENEKAQLVARAAGERGRPVTGASGQRVAVSPSPDGTADLGRELGAAREELDALRQALTQEHAARVAAESGEELSRARAELARQGALLAQIRDRANHPEG